MNWKPKELLDDFLIAAKSGKIEIPQHKSRTKRTLKWSVGDSFEESRFAGGETQTTILSLRRRFAIL